MVRDDQHSSSSYQYQGNNAKHCWWMQAGIVDYKLCDRDYDCEHCPFDDVLHGKDATRSAHSNDQHSDYPNNEQWLSRESCFRFPNVQGGEFRNDLFFHPSHTWARIEEGGTVRTGLDHFGQRLLGRAYAVDLPVPNTTLQRGEECWHFTHQAGVTAMVSPVSGTVKEINSKLVLRPRLLNSDPYGEGWAMLIEPTDLKGCLQRLCYRERAEQWLAQENERLLAKINEVCCSKQLVAGTTMTDGGLLRKDFMSLLTADQIGQVICSFFPSALLETDRNNSFLIKDGR